MPPTELISSTFSTQKPTYWLPWGLYASMVAKSELQFLETRNKNLCPASEIQFCGCTDTRLVTNSHVHTPGWVSGQSSSHSHPLMHRSVSLWKRKWCLCVWRGRLAGWFFSITWFWLHYNSPSLKGNDRKRKNFCSPGSSLSHELNLLIEMKGTATFLLFVGSPKRASHPTATLQRWKGGCVSNSAVWRQRQPQPEPWVPSPSVLVLTWLKCTSDLHDLLSTYLPW